MPIQRKLSQKWIVLCAFGFLLGGCRTSMDNYFKDLFNPEAAQAQKEARATSRLPTHESWCYRTLGKIDCYTTPQGGDSERLQGVDPPVRTPLTRESHADAALAAARK